MERPSSKSRTSFESTGSTRFSETNNNMGDKENEHGAHILRIIGEKGLYQMIVAGLCLMSNIVASWNVLGYSFFAYPMDYWCARPTEESFQNLTLAEWNNLSISANLINKSSKCYIAEMIYEDGVFGRSGETVKCEAWEFHDEIFHQTIVSKWSLVCENAYKGAASQTVYMVGSLLSVFIFGQLGDSLGRRPVLLFGIVLYLVAGLITSLVNSFFFFVFCRFFVALGIHGTTMTAFVVLMECCGKKYRPLYYLSLSIGWAIGYTTIPGLAFITRNWSYLQLSFVAFGLTLLPLWWYCLESPRWLLTQGKLETAESVLITAAQRNRMWNETTHVMIQQIILISDKEQKPRDATQSTLFHLLGTSNTRTKTLTMFYVWFTTSFVYYGLTLNLMDFVGDIFVETAMFGALEFVSAIIGCICFTYAMRRPTAATLFFVVGVLCFCNAGIPDSLRWVRSILATVGKVVIEIAFDLAYIYSAEIFPTAMRNAGVGTCSAAASVGSIVAPLMRDMANTTGIVVPMAFFGVVATVAGCLVFILPETKNIELQDTLEEDEPCLKNVQVKRESEGSLTGNAESKQKVSNSKPSVSP